MWSETVGDPYDLVSEPISEFYANLAKGIR